MLANLAAGAHLEGQDLPEEHLELTAAYLAATIDRAAYEQAIPGLAGKPPDRRPDPEPGA